MSLTEGKIKSNIKQPSPKSIQKPTNPPPAPKPSKELQSNKQKTNQETGSNEIMTKDELIKALENAECGNNKLDMTISTYIPDWSFGLSYTQSLDIALSLFDDVHYIELTKIDNIMWIIDVNRKPSGKPTIVTHKSAPIAVCIAYLKSMKDK